MEPNQEQAQLLNTLPIQNEVYQKNISDEFSVKVKKKNYFLKSLFHYYILIFVCSFIFFVPAVAFIFLFMVVFSASLIKTILFILGLIATIVSLLNLIFGIIYLVFSMKHLKSTDQNNINVIDSLRKLKKLSIKVLLFWLLAPVIAILISNGIHYIYPGGNSDKKESYSEKQEKYRIQDVNNRRQSQSDSIKIFLSRFKKEVEWKNSNFPGYGIISNNGNCSDPESGSLFKPDFKFIPKSEYINNKEWYDGQLARDLSVMFPDNGSGFDRFKANNNSDARCFSNEEHYAYQRPAYLEDPFPVFYCIDDMHPDVQKSNKQIKGPNCKDFDPNYVPPQTRPEPTDQNLKF